MPFLMDYTAPTGTNYPASWWLLAMTNIAHLGRTATLIFHGFADKPLYDAGNAPIEVKNFVVSDPDVFEQYIDPAIQQIKAQSFETLIESAAQVVTDFFATADRFSIAHPTAVEIGIFSDSRVVVTMNIGVDVATPPGPPFTFIDGVTIKVNGVAATISAATQNPSDEAELWYDLATPVAVSDEVTWEYDRTLGAIAEAPVALLRMASIAPMIATNNIGHSLKFNRNTNSGHLASAA